MKLDLIDCNCMVGRRSTPTPENNLSVQQILEELSYSGIDRALITHAFSRDYDPRIGNEKVSELGSRYPQFVPSYVLLPHHTGDFPGGDELLRYMESGGARAARLFPQAHSYGLGETWCGVLFATLEEASIPVFLDLDQTDWREIDQVLAHHPDLDLVLLRVGYRIDRWLYPLMKRYSGLRIEPAFYTLHRGIESITKTFGPGRQVFGTGLPQWNPGAAIAALQYAEIDSESRRQIGSENLETLLRLQTPEML